ncbi:MAG: ferrochelatase [Dehalobacterium sp.]
MIDKKTGVLLMNFGAPERPEDVEAFVTHICHGLKPPDHVLNLVKEKYSLMEGGSPLITTTMAQAKGLELELKRQGKNYPVYIGMLHSPPFIVDVVGQMIENGMERLLAISLAPFYSEVSTGAYYACVREAVANSPSDVSVSYGAEWNTHPSFIDAWVKRISCSLRGFSHPEEVNLIFTTHSLSMEPIEDTSGYQRQYQATVNALKEKLPCGKVHLTYQSKGKRSGKWLSPQVDEVIEKLTKVGEKSVLAVPIGFVADHLETLYDLDIEIKKQAELGGIDFRRITTFNDHPDFIKFLAELVLARE